MPYTRQTNTQRGGRGRGGRRQGGYRKRQHNKNDDKVVENKKFIEKCPFVVGTAEWAKWRRHVQI